MGRTIQVVRRGVLWSVGIVLALLLLTYVLIRLPVVQDFARGKAVAFLQEKLGTPVEIAKLRITFPRHIVLEGVFFEDMPGDTLFAGQSLIGDISLLKLLRNTLEINRLEFNGVTASVNRSLDGVYNFDYILKAFSDQNPKSSAQEATPMQLAVKKIAFNRTRLRYHDALSATDGDLVLGAFDAKVKELDLVNQNYRIDGVALRNATVRWVQGVPLQSVERQMSSQHAKQDSTPFHLQLGSIEFEQVRINYSSAVEAIQADCNFGNLFVKGGMLNLTGEQIGLEEIRMDNSDISVTRLESVKTSAIETDILSTGKDQIGWQFDVGSMTFRENAFAFTDLNQAPAETGMDFSRLGFSKINLETGHLSYLNSVFSGKLVSVSFAEQSGFVLKEMRGDFILGKQNASARNLLLETQKSKITGDLELKYLSFDSLSALSADVYQKTVLGKSHVAISDVLFWAPDLADDEFLRSASGEVVTFEADIEGRLDNILMRRLSFSGFKHTTLNLSGILKGLPDIAHTDVDLIIRQLDSRSADIYSLLPEGTIPDAVFLPEEFRISGKVRGNVDRFIANLKMQTSEGNGQLDGTLDLTEPISFQGSFALDALNLGKVLRQDSVLGPVTMEATGVLQDIGTDSLSGELSGRIAQMVYLGYPYTNLEFDGEANAGMIRGHATINDPNLQFALTGEAQVKDPSAAVKFEMRLGRANLQALHLSDQQITLQGLVTGDFASVDPDSLNGILVLHNFVITDSARSVVLDSLRLTSVAGADGSALDIESDFLKAHIAGTYQFQALIPAFMHSVSKYIPGASGTSSPAVTPQELTITADIWYSPVYSRFDSNVHSFAPVSLTGQYKSQGDFIALKAQSELVNYGGATFSDIEINLNTRADILQYLITWQKAWFGEKTFGQTALTGDLRGDTLTTDLTIKDSEDRTQYHLNAYAALRDTLWLISLVPESLLLNYQEWDVDANNEIMLASRGLAVRDVSLSRSGQRMDVRSEPYSLNSPLMMEFERFQIETITKMFNQDSLLAGGVISGHATARDIFGSPVFTADVSVDDFWFRGDTIGNVLLLIDNEMSGSLAADVQIEGSGNLVTVNGRYIVQDESIDLQMHIDRLKLSSIEAFSSGYITDGRGYIHGDLQITGPIRRPGVDGDLKFDSARVHLVELDSDFTLANEGVRFAGSDIYFDQFTITDEESNTLEVNGSVKTNTFSELAFNLDLTGENFKVLNTRAKDNDLYYGTLYLDSRISIRGALSNPEINADLTIRDNTRLTVIIPQTAPGIVEREGVVRFVDLDNPELDSVLAIDLDTFNMFSVKGYVIFANIRVTDEAEFKLVIDQGNGDFLEVKGDAELNASVDPSGKISLTGNYVLKEGIYELSFNFLKRRFDIRSGSTITWNGEPTSGAMNITAAYVVDAPPIDLVERQLTDATQTDLNLYKERLPFELILRLTGILIEPEVAFEIALPERNYPVAPEVISTVRAKLEQMSRDPAELNKQAFALVLLNRFIAEDPFKNVSGGTSAESYARQSVSKLLSQQLNNLASEIINGVDLSFDLESTEDYSTGQLQNRTDLSVSASKRILDDRITITLGSNFELEGSSNRNEKASNIVGDLIVEYQLSRDGRYLLKAYRKNEYEVAVEGQVVKTGLSFVIQLDYDKFSEILRKKDKDSGK